MPANSSSKNRSPGALTLDRSRLAASVILAVAAVPAAAQDDYYTDVYISVDCGPDGGTAVDISFDGLWIASNVPSVTSAELIGTEIRVRLDTMGGPVSWTFTDWSDSTRIEGVPPGAYSVVVDLYFWGTLFDSTVHGPVSTYFCPADLVEPYGVINFFDVSAFLNAYYAMDPAADFTGDGLYNFFDVAGYLDLYAAGCP